MEELKHAILLEDAVLFVQEKRYRRESSKNWKQIVLRKAVSFSVLNGEFIYRKKMNSLESYLRVLLCSFCFLCSLQIPTSALRHSYTCISSLKFYLYSHIS